MADERIQASAKPTVPDGTGFRRGRKKSPKEVVAPKEEENPKNGQSQSRDSLREILETIVFVAILVFMLKTFVAEAFIIPTGSMGPSLYGHHDPIMCPQCKYTFRVNISKEVDEDGQPEAVIWSRCPNCFYRIYRESPLLQRTKEFPQQ